MLGISGYEPLFFDRSDTFIKVFEEQLAKTIGLRLENYWLMWDPEGDEWYNDGPVILQIGSQQFEFTAYNLDDFSLTFDQIDRNKKIDWYGAGDDTPLIWNNKCNADINQLIGRKILDINIISFNFISTIVDSGQTDQTGFILHGIEFTFEKNGLLDNDNFLRIFNALDANGITTKEQKEDKQFQKTSMKRTT